MLESSSTTILLDPPNQPGSPSIKLEYHGFFLDLGAASDRLLDCFVAELTDRLKMMVELSNAHGWNGVSKSFNYNRDQVHQHLRGLMKEQARRRDVALRAMPIMVAEIS